jgi:hypothetical protein
MTFGHPSVPGMVWVSNFYVEIVQAGVAIELVEIVEDSIVEYAGVFTYGPEISFFAWYAIGVNREPLVFLRPVPSGQTHS